MFRDHGVKSYHKPINTLRSLLVKPKDKPDKNSKCGVVYQVSCGDCHHNYVGETARALGTRIKEHTDGNCFSAVNDHLSYNSHHVGDVKVLAQEDRTYARKIREALEIHKSRPTLNRDPGIEVPPVLLQLLPPKLPPVSRDDNTGHVTKRS